MGTHLMSITMWVWLEIPTMLLRGSVSLLFLAAQLQVGRVTEPGYGLSLFLTDLCAAVIGSSLMTKGL